MGMTIEEQDLRKKYLNLILNRILEDADIDTLKGIIISEFVGLGSVGYFFNLSNYELLNEVYEAYAYLFDEEQLEIFKENDEVFIEYINTVLYPKTEKLIY